ncbi:MAG: uroporphyrinogen-III C-methyltransferase [Magnetococcales bacterium]|nr:uroporphyrinogen-III C-methyltransferase [Magnetococcales bacterium]
MDDNDNEFLPPGCVALVGAGPGNPDLFTLGGLKYLQAADVVVYDALVSEEILALIPEPCEKIFAGKRGGRPSPSQSDISETLVKLAAGNKRVVRLKGGDPFIFGRGGEEALYLARKGVPFRIMPGLSSGIAGLAYAGIPVTHRDCNANLMLITGHEAPENLVGMDPNDATRLDWVGIARSSPVMVLYMAMQYLDRVTRRLMEAGRDPKTPVAIVRWATTPRQETLVTTLERAAEDVEKTGMAPPAIIAIGEVVRLRESLAWFPDRTLLPDPE